MRREGQHAGVSEQASARVVRVLDPPERRAGDAADAVLEFADGKTMPVDCTVRLWDLQTGLQLKEFPGHKDRVESVAFSADGRRAISTSADKSVRVWDLALQAANP